MKIKELSPLVLTKLVQTEDFKIVLAIILLQNNTISYYKNEECFLALVSVCSLNKKHTLS